jgi:hypothetical protein
MRKRTLLGTVFATLALSASIAGITAGVADAKPREVNCIVLNQVADASWDVAQAAYAQGDDAAGDSHFADYLAAQENIDRYCLS